MPRVRPRLAAIVAITGVVLAAALWTLAADEPADGRPFATDSAWNRRLPDDAPLDPRSDAYVADLRRQLGLAEPTINTSEFSSPVYVVARDAPTTRVQLDNNSPDLQRSWERVPIPDGARPASGTDGHLVVWQPSTDRMWEFWVAEHRKDGWHARWGGTMENVSSNPGHYTAPHPEWGATATSLPLLAGLMRIEELRRGRVEHALALAVPEASSQVFSLPAQRTDGKNPSPSAIPAGAHLRLDPTLDLSALNLPQPTRMVAEAAQRYGMIVRDQSGAITLYAEDPTPTGRDPYASREGLFRGASPQELLRPFPWDRLQVLKTQLRPTSP